jgi:anti-repressor protein
MNDLQVFNNAMFGNVRILMRNNEPWFVAKDVCDCLEINNSRQALSRLDADEKSSVILNDGTPGNPEKSVVNEYGLYSLVMSSRKPEAKEFRRWITHEVLPSIRMHGAYMTSDVLKQAIQSPDFLIQLASQLKSEQDARRHAELTIVQQAPKVLFADAVATSHTSILIGDLAKLLKQNGVDTGQKRLFEQLRSDGYLIKSGNSKNMPTQRSMEMGLFEVKESTLVNSDGSTRITRTTKVTGKGQVYFVNKYAGRGGIVL